MLPCLALWLGTLCLLLRLLFLLLLRFALSHRLDIGTLCRLIAGLVQLLVVAVGAQFGNFVFLLHEAELVVVAQAARAGQDHTAGLLLQLIGEAGISDLQIVQPCGIRPVIPAEQKDDQYKE